MNQYWRHFQDLLIEFTKRDIKQRYKQSVLGYAWVIINPFAQMIVMAIVFSIIIRIPSLGIPYPLFLYAGLLPWLFFSQSLVTSVNVLIEHAALIKKIAFPREVLVLSTVLAKLVDFGLAGIIMVAFLLYYQIPFSWTWLWFPVLLFFQIVFTTGLSLLVSALNLFYRDIQHLLSLIILLWMYLTPVIYSLAIVPEKYQLVFRLNPMAILIEQYRNILFFQHVPTLFGMIYLTLASSLTLMIGIFVFKKLEGYFADVV